MHRAFPIKAMTNIERKLRRDKARSLPFEELTAEQRDWLKLDRVLDRRWFEENSQNATSADAYDVKKGNWNCSFDDKALNILATKRELDMKTDDEHHAWKLMDMFYVRDDG
eukprot:11870966-Ditylum_brightwellii.AAC.1